MSLKNKKIYLAGHSGLVGSAIKDLLENQGYKNVIFKTHKELNLTNQRAVSEFFAHERPEVVIYAAGKVGGMLAQLEQKPEFLYENLMMAANTIHAAATKGCEKFINIGSLCIYPKDAMPITEESLFQGELQPNNEPYAIAKIAGLKMGEYFAEKFKFDFISIMPISVYGSNDRFDLLSAHVQAAIFRKIYLAKLLNESKFEELLADLEMSSINEAREFLKGLKIDENGVQLLGTGKASREFMHTNDLARAVLMMLEINAEKIAWSDKNGVKHCYFNAGSGEDISIKGLAETIAKVIEYKGEIKFENDSSKDGTIKKITDLSKIHALGWKAQIPLEMGLKMMYEDYVKNAAVSKNAANLKNDAKNRAGGGGI